MYFYARSGCDTLSQIRRKRYPALFERIIIVNFSTLKRFPLGAIRAKGFLREQMLRCKEGLAGNLYKLEPTMILYPFIDKKIVDTWDPVEQSGWGAEISGNFWTGYIQHAFVLGDEEMIEKATWWVNTMMAKQRPDGYLGTYYEPDAKIYEDYNAWGCACAMRGLIAFYEVTGREDVLRAVHDCLLWFTREWAGDKKTCYAAPFIMEPMIFCYHLTGDERLLAFCREYEEYLEGHDTFRISYRAFLEGDYIYTSNHTAGMGCSTRLPALVYTATGEENRLAATRRIIDNIRTKSMHLSGAPVSVNEYLGPVSSIAEAEYCSFAFFNATYSYMSYITGEAKWGDYMEEMFYNAAEGARKKDERAIAYLSAPNQIYATDESSTCHSNSQVYAPCYPTSCCPVNAVAVLPEFVRGLINHDGEDGVYVTAYGPCRLDYEGMGLEVETLYPFRNSVKIKIHGERELSLYLKVPEWCEGYTVTVNGKTVTAPRLDSGYAELQGKVKAGDTVEISFTASVKVLRVDDSDASAKHPVAIKYGALLFSYHIPEIWQEIPGTPNTPLPEGWYWYNVNPYCPTPDNPDSHERLGLLKYHTSWNVAMDEELSSGEVAVELTEPTGYVWENPPIKLHTHAYRAPWLCAPYPTRTFEPFGQRQPVTDRVELELVPYGCTNLRITYFPRAELSGRNAK